MKLSYDTFPSIYHTLIKYTCLATYLKKQSLSTKQMKETGKTNAAIVSDEFPGHNLSNVLSFTWSKLTELVTRTR